MTEIDREAVLYERAQARLAKIERRELERKMRELEASASVRPARAPTASMEKKRKTLDELKARRERRRRRDSDSEYSGDEGYGQEDGEVDINKDSATEPESEDEDEDKDHYRDSAYGKLDGRKSASMLKSIKKTSTATAQHIDLDAANLLRLPRDAIAKWIFHPQFDDLARGCLMRLSIGFKGDEQVYRLVEVRKIVTYHRNYKINETATNKAAILRYGKNEKTFRLDVISNAAFTQKEFDRWIETMREEHQPIITMRAAESRIRAWRELEARPLSDEIISAMVAAKRELGAAPRNLVAERTMLIHQREEALNSANTAEVERIEEELSQLENEMASQSSRGAAESRLHALAELNRRNRRMNVAAAREADRKNLKRSVAENKLDPFSRRKCQPTNFNILFDSNTNTPEPEPEPGSASASASSIDGSLIQSEEISAEEAEPVVEEKDTDQTMDLFAAHNVDIDIDI